MPKRKSGSHEPSPFPTPSLTSLDAALDLLACETFTRLSSLTAKFETAAGVKLNDGVIKHRWEEACMRYWLMKSMDDLSCAGSSKPPEGENEANGEIAMTDDDPTVNGESSVTRMCVRHSFKDLGGIANPRWRLVSTSNTKVFTPGCYCGV